MLFQVNFFTFKRALLSSTILFFSGFSFLHLSRLSIKYRLETFTPPHVQVVFRLQSSTFSVSWIFGTMSDSHYARELQTRPGQVVPLRAVPIRAVVDHVPIEADLKAAPLAPIMLSNIARVHRLIDPGRPAAGSPPSVITGCNGEVRCKKASMSAAYRWLMIY